MRFYNTITRTFKLSILLLIFSVNASLAQTSSERLPVRATPTANDVENIDKVKCSMEVPAGHYILAESFFANFDNVVNRVAMLRQNGFENATFIHTTCQSFDVDKELYAVIIHGPVRNKTELYPVQFEAYEIAKNEGFKLITTRIIYCEQ